MSLAPLASSPFCSTSLDSGTRLSSLRGSHSTPRSAVTSYRGSSAAWIRLNMSVSVYGTYSASILCNTIKYGSWIQLTTFSVFANESSTKQIQKHYTPSLYPLISLQPCPTLSPCWRTTPGSTWRTPTPSSTSRAPTRSTSRRPDSSANRGRWIRGI